MIIMKRHWKFILIVIILLIIGFITTSNILFIATDTTEGGDSAPGVDMAATWSLTGGFQWIYPGSSHNSQGETLHNIYYNNPDNPFKAAADIMEYTYNIRPHLVVTINNAAAESIFGSDIVDNIRDYDWNQGYGRGNAVEMAMGNGQMNIIQIPINILTGNIAFHFA